MQFGGGDMNDILAAMMGGGMGGMGGGRQQQQRRKGRDVGIAFPVTLEDLYNGKTLDVPREKDIICPDCKGTGTKSGKSAVCPDCRGQGARMMMRQMGNMITQQQVACSACSGTGGKAAPNDKCGGCDAKRIVSKQMPLKVTIERGMKADQQIPFMGEGDQHPDIDIPGAIVVVLKQKEHTKFKRDGNDLKMVQVVSLADALCGFQFVIEHLDGRKLVVRNTPGQMLKPGDIKCIVGEGMPIQGKAGKAGDLIIEFTIQFPDRLQDGQVEALAKVLPAKVKPTEDLTDAEVHHVDRHPLEEVRKAMNQEDDDDDDNGQGGGGVQCASH